MVEGQVGEVLEQVGLERAVQADEEQRVVEVIKDKLLGVLGRAWSSSIAPRISSWRTI